MSDYQDQDYTQGGAYAALIEWDGKRPPTRWYDRLHALGYRIGQRGDKTPLDRRQGHNGVAFQEGALLCREESEARTLCFLASELGARSAIVIAYTAIDTTALSVADREALSRVQSVLGRRGRPPKATPTVSYCYDCGHTTLASGAAFRCDHCGGTDLRVRQGEQRKVRLPRLDQGTLTGYCATRYLEGALEEPDLRDWDDPAAEVLEATPDTVAIPDSFNAVLHTEAYASLKAAYDSQKLHWREFYRGLDLIQLVQRQNDTLRLENRIAGITKFVRAGGDASHLMVAVRPGVVDLIDLYGAVRDSFIQRILLTNTPF